MLLILALPALAAFPNVASARSTHPENKLVDFERSGAWEIWCIEQGDTREVICDLNLVIIYKPHPDFRAMIPRVYLAAAEDYWIEFEHEFQTSLSDLSRTGDGARFSMRDCDRPCTLRGAPAQRFVEFLATSEAVKVHFTDYLVQDFSVDFDLEGFREGLSLLKDMQLRNLKRDQ